MRVILVRHGESQGNAEGRFQGLKDYELTEQGRQQAARLGAWFAGQQLAWDAAYVSPLLRARETLEIVRTKLAVPEPTVLADLHEIHNGALSDLNRAEMAERYPSFLQRPLDTLGDFSEFGGESYSEVQRRVERLRALFKERHRPGQRLLVMAHGGIHAQLLKSLICLPVPQLCLLRIGNCCATQVTLQERRGQWLGELGWHLPLELMGG